MLESGLSKDEIEKMKQAAKEHAAEDIKKKESVEIRNKADNLVFSTKKQITDLGDKIPAELKNRLESEIKKVEDAIATNDTANIKTATENMEKVWSEISQELYKAQSAQGQQAPNEGSANNEPPKEEPASGKKSDGPEVQDASYEVVDDDK